MLLTILGLIAAIYIALLVALLIGCWIEDWRTGTWEAIHRARRRERLLAAGLPDTTEQYP